MAEASYGRELERAREAARGAGAILLRHFERGTQQWEKSGGDPVTAADLEADRYIAEQLRGAFPEDGLLSEETADSAARLDRERVWIVDPMDGTREFTQRIPEFAVSIALAVRGEPVVGVVENPAAGVAAWAVRGGGSHRDGGRVSVARPQRLADAVVLASRSEWARGELRGIAPWFRELRPVGSIAWKLARIAAGEGDLQLSLAPKSEWDVCAGDLLVREAGGILVGFDGAPRRYNRSSAFIEAGLVAGEPALVRGFLARWRSAGGGAVVTRDRAAGGGPRTGVGEDSDDG